MRMVVSSMTEPRNALVKQYKKLFHLEGVELEFKKEALEAIVKKAIERGTGARALRTVADIMAEELGWDEQRINTEIQEAEAVYQTVT